MSNLKSEKIGGHGKFGLWKTQDRIRRLNNVINVYMKKSYIFECSVYRRPGYSIYISGITINTAYAICSRGR
jgi:hypothetical protein